MIRPLLVLAQADQPASETPPEIQDKTGQIDVDATTVWETVDNMVDGLLDRLPFIILGVVIFFIFFIIAKVARRIIRKSTEKKDSANLGRVIGRITQWSLIFVGLMVGVAVISPSITPGKLLTTLGVGGVAIGFAFKDILQNFMAGLLILIREPFTRGDQIISGDFEGTVESIETRATIIKTYDGRRVVIPNSQIYTNPVVVNTAYDARRSQYDIGIGYGDDLRHAAEVILKTLQNIEGVLQDPAPEVLVVELAGSSVNLRARWWTKADQATVIHTADKVIGRIKEALDDSHVDMPYPTQVVLFHDQTEETDGDRTRQREGWPTGEDPPEPKKIATTLENLRHHPDDDSSEDEMAHSGHSGNGVDHNS